MPEFATVTLYQQETSKGAARGDFYCVEVGLGRAHVDLRTEVHQQFCGGPDPRDGQRLVQWWATQLWVNRASTPISPRELWFSARDGAGDIRVKQIAAMLRAWGFVPVEEALAAPEAD